MTDPGIADLAQRLLDRRTAGAPLIVGLTGSVAAGKSTLARALVEALSSAQAPLVVESVSTDGFLRPNAELDAAGLTLRKGWPQTYDHAALAGAVTSVRVRPTVFPGYSHLTYDIDPALQRTIEPPDVLIIEGLGFEADTPLDVRLFLDADEANLEAWYVGRFLGLAKAGRDEPGSFYHRFRDLDAAGVATVARQVWAAVNLPNLREHIRPLRPLSDLVIAKRADHAIERIAPPGPAHRGAVGEPSPS